MTPYLLVNLRRLNTAIGNAHRAEQRLAVTLGVLQGHHPRVRIEALRAGARAAELADLLQAAREELHEVESEAWAGQEVAS